MPDLRITLGSCSLLLLFTYLKVSHVKMWTVNLRNTSFFGDCLNRLFHLDGDYLRTPPHPQTGVKKSLTRRPYLPVPSIDTFSEILTIIFTLKMLLS